MIRNRALPLKAALKTLGFVIGLGALAAVFYALAFPWWTVPIAMALVMGAALFLALAGRVFEDVPPREE